MNMWEYNYINPLAVSDWVISYGIKAVLKVKFTFELKSFNLFLISKTKISYIWRKQNLH